MSNKSLYNKYSIIFLSLVLFTGVSCKKFVASSVPKTEITSETVFTTDASAISAINGIYSLMSGNTSFTNGYLEFYTGLSSDEFYNYNPAISQSEFFDNALSKINTEVLGVFWTEAYKYIYNANGLLEGLSRSSSLSPNVKAELEGEAKFIRAYCHFYLVNLFGPVPYIKTTDYRVNSTASRMGEADVYSLIVEDLLSSQSLLADDFSFSQGLRVQPNKGAATAMLAKVYLFMGEWNKAIEQSSLVIANENYSLVQELDQVFLSSSPEAIWQLQPVIEGFDTKQAQLFLINTVPDQIGTSVSLSDEIYNAFENDDKRKLFWTGTFTDDALNEYHFSSKYKVLEQLGQEYAAMLRLSEQYLIRAEARTQVDDLDNAKDDINAIRNRAGLLNTTANDKASLLLAIEQERKVELFAEGHRWLDLKRTQRAMDVLGPVKPGLQAKDLLYPIPESERLVNPNLTQNPEY